MWNCALLREASIGSGPKISQTTLYITSGVTFAAGSSLLFHYVADKALYACDPARCTGYAHGHGCEAPYIDWEGGRCGVALLYG